MRRGCPYSLGTARDFRMKRYHGLSRCTWRRSVVPCTVYCRGSCSISEGSGCKRQQPPSESLREKPTRICLGNCGNLNVIMNTFVLRFVGWSPDEAGHCVVLILNISTMPCSWSSCKISDWSSCKILDFCELRSSLHCLTKMGSSWCTVQWNYMVEHEQHLIKCQPVSVHWLAADIAAPHLFFVSQMICWILICISAFWNCFNLMI